MSKNKNKHTGSSLDEFMSDDIKKLKEHFHPSGDETAWSTAIKRITELEAENDKLRAENYVLRDVNLRTYDGLAQKADRVDEVEAKLKIAVEALEMLVKSEVVCSADFIGYSEAYSNAVEAFQKLKGE